MEFSPNENHSDALVGNNNKTPRVAYFYDPDVGSFYYGPGHPMKPQRIRMAHSLILSYNLYKNMDVYQPHKATVMELLKFHDADYVDYLAEVSVKETSVVSSKLPKYNVGEGADCPIFDGLLEFQSSCAGASIDAATQLNHKTCDIAINWSGGLHHAKRAEASGFCYINDIVLCILELLKFHGRVMYIDIDVHHGDGVEEAFYFCHRVLTVSFHRYGNFFPGTGALLDVGGGIGKYYSVNIPLNDGMPDELYIPLYKDVISKCIEVFRPDAIVLQCGADSVTGDRLGSFNLSTYGHGACVNWTKNLGIPLLILGGGGYTIRNVARTWLYETAVALNKQNDIDNYIPQNEYYQYYAPNYQLHLEANSNLPNKNTPSYCASIKEKVFTHLQNLEPVPSVPFITPPDDLRYYKDDIKLSEYEQLVVDWEGGGLAIDYNYSLPYQLFRGDKRMQLWDELDRDQKKQLEKLRIEVSMYDNCSGDESDIFY